jgi:MFS family permease
MAPLPARGTPWHFFALSALYGVYYGMAEGAEKALVTDFVPSAQRGTAFGVYHGAIGLAALPASLIFGVLWVTLNKAYGEGVGPQVAFGIGAALAGLSALLLVLLLSVARERERVAA